MQIIKLRIVDFGECRERGGGLISANLRPRKENPRVSIGVTVERGDAVTELAAAIRFERLRERREPGLQGGYAGARVRLS